MENPGKWVPGYAPNAHPEVSGMNGIRISPIGSSPLPGGVGSFSLCFVPILGRLKHLHWITSWFDFNLPVNWGEQSEYDEAGGVWTSGPLKEFQDYILGYSKRYFLAKPGMIPRFARYVDDDWTYIYGLTDPPGDLGKWLESCRAGRRRKRVSHIEQTVEVYFGCYDGVLWIMLARREDLLETVVSHLQQYPELKVRRIDLVSLADDKLI